MINAFKVLVVLLVTVSTTSAFAIPFTNGDFSSGMAGWNDASSSGSASVIGGEAVLQTGDFADLYSAILIQGDDGSFNFSSPISLGTNDFFLNFDASVIDLGIDITESGGSFFTDELFISVYDEFDPFYDTTFYSLGLDSSSAGLGYIRYNLDISSLAGRTVALSFELSDEDDGRNTKVLLDNISFSQSPVPAPPPVVPVGTPGTITLFILGVLLMAMPVVFRHNRGK